MTNEEVFKNYGSEKWVVEEALSYLLQKYWEEVVQKYPQIEKQIGMHCPINPVGAVKEFMKEDTLCSVEYAEKSKMETLQAEGDDHGNPVINTNLPYPLCIIEDRYCGVYSGARFLAFNMEPYHVQELPIDAGDTDCENFWNGKDKDYDINDYIIGKGETPEDAVWDLISLLRDKVDEEEREM
ncbi:MAG: hypothetical protein IKO10_03790 [Lachnospiraceae bacterium]|nr:hypothetical protein [Lachnospiraceae bacterium]